MKPVYTVATACSVLVLCSAVAQSAPLYGTMLINPGTLQVIGSSSSTVYTGGSYFAMNGNPNTGSMLSPGSAGGIVLGTYQNFVLNPDVPHPYNWNGMGAAAGTGYSSAPPTTQSTMMAPFDFGQPTYLGTNPVSYQSGEAHAAPTADISNCVGSLCTLSVDLSSWEVMWNGNAFEQGPRPSNSGPFVLAVGTYDMVTTAYSLTWRSQIKGGPFNGVTPTWHLEGTVSAVPVPAAVWLLGSGLVGFLGVVRRKVGADK